MWKYPERLREEEERFLWTINIDLDIIDYVFMHIKQTGNQIMKTTLSRHVTQSLAYLKWFHKHIVALPTLVIVYRSKGDNYGIYSLDSTASNETLEHEIICMLYIVKFIHITYVYNGK